MRKFIIFIPILLISLYCSGQEIPKPGTPKVFSVTELKADFAFFRTAMETLHPSLYRYQPKDSMNYYFDTGLAKIDHPMQTVEFWELVQNTISKAGSGHTDIDPGKAFITNYNYSKHYILPFYIYIRDNRVYVKNYIGKTDTAFSIGDEVISVNYKPALSILNRERNFLTGDGYSNSYKDSQLEIGAFNRLYNLLNDEQNRFTVTFKSGPVTKTRTIKAAEVQNKKADILRLYGSSQRSEGAPLNPEDSAKSLHEVTYLKDMPSTALLRISNFTYDDYSSFHKKLFKELKQKSINNLVIDLRNNAGGNERACIDLMKYLVDKNFYFTAKEDGMIDLGKFAGVIEKANRKNSGIIDLSQVDRKPYELKTYANEPQVANEDGFRGSIYLLINGGTYSAAALLVTALKTQTPCVTIGQETGGGLAGCDGGSSVDINLPNTRFRLRMPLLWTYSVSKEQNHGKGLQPDIIFLPSATDIYNKYTKNIDPFIEKLKTVIVSNK